MTRGHLRTIVAATAALATLAIAVQYLVIEPTALAARRTAAESAAREAALAAVVVRAGGAPAGVVRIARVGAFPDSLGGVAPIGGGRVVWVPAPSTAGFVEVLRRRVLLVAVTGALAVCGWALWAGLVRRRHEVRAARSRIETIGMVAHDLRSPLTGIGLAADRLARSDLPAARVAARAAIARECARVAATADDILTVCTASVRDEDDEAVEMLSDVLEDVAARVRSAHGCAVLVEADLDARGTRADRRLVRAVANVAENAARHTPPGTAIRLRAVLHDGDVEVVVEDDGAGFAPGFRPAAFLRGASQGRAGLGLASSRRIVECLGGTLRLGRHGGGGAAVSLRLPTREAAP